jgi:endonuclease-3
MITKQSVEKIFTIFNSENPNPKIELNYSNHFTLLVAIILSAQCTDKKVNEVTNTLFPKYDSPIKILALGLSKLKEYIKSIGLFNNKAKNIILLSEILDTKYNSIVPLDFDQLILLPGVGRKSANVFLNSALGLPVMPVDTHVFRVARRLDISQSTNLLKVEQDLVAAIPIKFLVKANQWLVLHGRYICKARKPLCLNCKINAHCKYFQSNNQQSL